MLALTAPMLTLGCKDEMQIHQMFQWRKKGHIYFVVDMLFVLMDELLRDGRNPLAFCQILACPSCNRVMGSSTAAPCLWESHEAVADRVFSRILGVSLS